MVSAMVTETLLRAIQRAGSEAKLGAAIGFSQNAIWQAKSRGRVSARMAKKIDEWSDGEFSRRALCPEVFGPLELVTS